MEEEGRRKTIIEYISENQGCNKENIVDVFKNQISRVTVLHTIEGLIKDGMVRIEKEKENSREQKLFVNFDNMLVSVPKELEEFKIAYINLLNKSKEHLQNKDLFLERIKTLGINESNPDKWTESESLQYEKFVLDELKKSKSIFVNYLNLIARIVNQTKKIKAEIINDFFPNEKTLENIFVDKDKFLLIKTKYIPELKLLESNVNSSKDIMRKSHFLIEITLIYLIIEIFKTLVDIFTYRSLLIWPAKNYDIQTLNKLYLIVNTKISEIQLELSNFIKSIKYIPFLKKSNLAELIFLFQNVPSINLYIGSLKSLYQFFNIESEYNTIIESISNIVKEIQLYGYKINVNNKLEEIRTDIETIDKVINLINLQKED